MYLFTFYVPVSHLESTKQAVFATGAGRYENYDSCCWQTSGQGQFRALEGSNPFIGQQGEIEKVEEYKVEMMCAEEHLEAAMTAMKEAHPYEEPAYHAIAVKV